MQNEMQKSARQAALECLDRCRRDGAWSGAALDGVIRKYALSGREAALASRLCLGVLQNESLCDYYIGCFCRTKLENTVRDILRMGVYQILFLDRIPVHAAVSESVELCRAAGLSRACGLVNAVLRRIAAEKDSLPAIPGEGTADYLSVRYSHPLWLCEYLCRQHGYSFAMEFLSANNRPACLCLQVNTLKVDPRDYMRALDRAEIPYRELEPIGCLELEGGSAASLPGYEQGLFYIQDRAARIAAEIAAPEPGMRVLDACACPGGKSFAAAIRMRDRGSILACDIHEKKLGLLRNGARRLGIGIIGTRVMDARAFDPTMEEVFDAVIADVPCSGLGVIAKKPEIRGKKPEDLLALPEIQYAIVSNVSRYVKPGGVLLYATCTVRREENEDVALRFLKANPAFRAEAFQIAGISGNDGMYTFWPQVNGTDGFFAAKFRKNG